MDFHSLSRKELQTLCKKNRIPANVTNVAMADALNALEIVDGLDEIINQSSEVPRTANRTSTRRRPTKLEASSTQPATRTRCVTRRAIAGELDQENLIETPAEPTTRRRAPSVVDVGEEDVDSLETPAVLQSGHGRVPQGSTRRKAETQKKDSVQQVYGTRRSVRLLEKGMAGLSLIEPKNADEIAAGQVGEKDGNSEAGSHLMSEGILRRNLSESLEEEGGFIEDLQENSKDVHSGVEKCLVKHKAISEESDNFDNISALDNQDEASSKKTHESDVHLDNVSALEAKDETTTQKIDESDISLDKISAAYAKYEAPSLEIDESNARLGENPENAAEMNDETIDEKGSDKDAIPEDSYKSNDSTVDVVSVGNKDSNPYGAKPVDLFAVEVSDNVLDETMNDDVVVSECILPLEVDCLSGEENVECTQHEFRSQKSPGKDSDIKAPRIAPNLPQGLKESLKKPGIPEFSCDSENYDAYLAQVHDGSDFSDAADDNGLGSEVESVKKPGIPEFSSDSGNSKGQLDQVLDGSNVSDTDSDNSSEVPGELEEQAADQQECIEVCEAATAFLLKEMENAEEHVKIEAKELGINHHEEENTPEFVGDDTSLSKMHRFDEEFVVATDECPQFLDKTPAGAKQMSPSPSLVPSSEVVTNTKALQFPRPIQLTPKTSSSKKQTTIQKAPQVSDINNENINNSAWKLEPPTLVSMNKDKNNDEGIIMQKADEESYKDMSMRQIKKMLKELTISKNKNNEDKPVEKSRPALQPLPDNLVGAGERQK